MKNKLAKAGLCMLAAGLLFTSSVYAAEISSENVHSDISTSTSAFWRKKDKEAAPETESPEASPLPSPSPSSEPTVAPKDAPKETPGTEPKESSEVTPDETPKETPKETSLVTHHNNKDAHRQNPAPAPSPVPTPSSNQSENRHHNNHNVDAAEHRHSNYMSDISVELQKVLTKKPGIKLDADAYIVQHDGGLWLVMGNIRAKLDILIYVDQKNMAETGLNHDNAIPLYK